MRCGASWGVVSRSRRARGGGTKSKGPKTQQQTRRKALASLATHRSARSTGGNRKTRRERRWLQHGRAASQAWPLRGSRSSHASRTHTGGALSVGVIACDAAEARPRALWLLPPRGCVWMRDVLTVVCSNQMLCSPQPHPGRAVRMRDGRAFTRRSLHRSVGERRPRVT